MKKQFYYFLLAALLMFTAAFIYGCGSSATGGGSSGSDIANRSGTYSYSGSQAPGDVWSWTISTETFLGSNETSGFWVTGEWTTLSSGFGKLHVTDSSSTSAIGKYAYFVEYPETALMVIPTSESNNVIVCAAKVASKPSSSQNYVWVALPGYGWNTGVTAAYGTADATFGTPSNFDALSYHYDDTYKDHGANTYNFSSATGKFTPTGSGSEEIVMTPSGIIIGDNGAHQGGFIGVSIETFSSIEAANHEYRGVASTYYPATHTTECYFIAATKNTSINGSLTGYLYKDNAIESGTDLTKFVTFKFGSQTNGIISTEVSEATDAHILKSVFAKISSSTTQKNILFGININGSGLPENFLFIQTD
jgi:hypothetical protein